MELSLLQEMQKNMDEFIEQNIFDNKCVVIFGSNESGEKMMEYLAEHNILVDAIVDNNPKKDGTVLYGVSVMLPEKYLVPKRENCVVLIASRYYPEMAMQLEAMGYKEGTEILKTAEYSAQMSASLTEEEFEKRVQVIKRGEELYQRICGTMPEVEKLFVCPPAELGATYVGMSFLRQYMEKHGIEKFLIVTRNGACAKVAYLFGYEEQVVKINREEMDFFLQYAVFTDMADGQILVMNHRHPYTCRIGEIGNYKGINFIDHFRYSIFELDDAAQPEVPYIHRNDEESRIYVEELFQKYELEKGKTVILMPYANTAPRIDILFWERLAEALQQKGYIVCTNSSGDTEPAIHGTIPLFFDIRYSLEVVEAAGTMIALRSGFCDVLSTAKAKKIIIYPNRIYGPGKFMDFYHLVKIGLSEEADEFEWNGETESTIHKLLE